MKIKSIICAISLFAVTVAVSAQASFGVVAGVNVSKLRCEEESLDPKAGFHVGVLLDRELIGNLHIQPSLVFTQRGSEYEETQTIGAGITAKESVTEVLNYLQLPVEVSYRMPIGPVSLDINVGPYFSMGLNGKIKYKAEGSMSGISAQGEKEFKNAFKDDGDMKAQYKRFDSGLRFGLGTHLLGHLGVGLYYDLGFVKLNKESVEDKFAQKNGSFLISASLSF